MWRGNESAIATVRWRLGGLRLLLALLFVSSPGSALEVAIGSGVEVSFGSVDQDFSGADLSVQGTVDAGSSLVDQVKDLTIEGTLDGSSATINVCGNWSRAGGTFIPGTSSVNLIDGCGITTATITGSTTFYDFSMQSSSGKTWQFEAGSTQVFTNQLTILGGPGFVNIASTVSGVAALFDLEGALDSNTFVSVQDNDGTAGSTLLAGIVGSNTSNWQELEPEVEPGEVPTLSGVAILVTVGIVVGAAFVTRARSATRA